ncbi:hypothetical protein HG530_009613 [Fusarium avenaceum]|nr:hypothetical protein HG530_009613 [Fusarium avenaceum]
MATKLTSLSGSLESSTITLVVNILGELFGLGNSFHQRLTNDLVLVNSDEGSLSLWCSFKDSLDGFNTLQGSQHSVIGDSSSTSLDVTESGNTSIKSKAALTLVSQDILDLFGADLLSVLVARAFSDNNDCLTLSEITVL